MNGRANPAIQAEERGPYPRCAAVACPFYCEGYGSEQCANCPGPIGRNARPRSCHSCRWNGRGLPVCVTCPGPAESSNEGQNWVRPDDAPAPDELIEREREKIRDEDESADGIYETPQDREARKSGETVTASLSADVENALRIVLAELAQLERRDRELFFEVYNGSDRDEAGRAIGITKQAAKYRFDRMMRANTPISAFLKGCLTVRDGIGGGANRGKRKGGFVQLQML